MKRCPQCNHVYAEDDLNFCLIDGASLVATHDSEATLVMSPPSFKLPSAIGPPSQPQSSRQGVSPLFAYAAVGLLALLVVGAVVMWLKSEVKTSKPEANQNTLLSTANSASQNSSVLQEEPKANRNQLTSNETQTPNPVTPPTVASVQSLMSRWENAQESRNFSAYETCYAYSFRGVLRTTSGQVKVYGFNDWMKGRKRMIGQSGGLAVDVKNIRILIDGDTATVEFDQYYYSGSYRDWGPKVIRIKATPTVRK